MWQSVTLIVLALLSLFISLKSFFESSKKNNVFEETPALSPLGVFVWGDGLIFGPFWFLTSIVTLFLSDFVLFCLTFSVFWVVRSFGESIYWFNQQFSTIERNPPQKLRGYSIVKNDSVWFLYQIVWQCVAVISIITSIYFGVMWVKGIL